MLLSPLHRPLSPLRSPQQHPADARTPPSTTAAVASSSTPTSPTISSRRSKKRPLDPSAWLVGLDGSTRPALSASREADKAPHVLAHRRPYPSASFALVASGHAGGDGEEAMRQQQQQQLWQHACRQPSTPLHAMAATLGLPTVVVLDPNGGRLSVGEDDLADDRELMDEDDAAVDPHQQHLLIGRRDLSASRSLSTQVCCWAGDGESATDLRCSVQPDTSGQVKNGSTSGINRAASRPSRGSTNNKRSRSPSPTLSGSTPRTHRFRWSGSSSSRTTPPTNSNGDLLQTRPPTAIFLPTCTTASPLKADLGHPFPSPLVDDGDDDVEMTLPPDDPRGGRSKSFGFGGRAGSHHDQGEPVGAHTSVGWHRRRTTTAAATAPVKAVRRLTDEDDQMADEPDPIATGSSDPPPPTLSSSFPRASSRLQSLSHGLAALRTDRPSAGSSSSSSSAGVGDFDGQNVSDSALSPFPLTPGLYEPGTRGRERMAALMGLLPSPPSGQWRGSTPMQGLATTNQVENRTLDSPFRRRRAAVDSTSHGGQLQQQYTGDCSYEPPLSRSLPTTRTMPAHRSSDLEAQLDGNTPAGLRSILTATQQPLQQHPNGRFIVDYLGPRDEQPW